MSNVNILVGADPEVFLATKTNNIISAHDAIPGTKAKPFKVEDGAVQVDGMALEFNIDPAKDEKEFIHNIQSVMNQLQAMLPKDHTLVIQSTAHFTKEYIEAQPEKAKELGCDPDYNCYTKKANVKPDASNCHFRTAAGHVHVGWTNGEDPHDPEHFEAACMLAQQLDWFLGVPGLLFDLDHERRKLYGKAGAFRPKPYGMEYRVLSNAWLNDAELMAWVYRNTKLAFERLIAGEQIGRIEGQKVSFFFDNHEEWDLTPAIVAYADHYNIPLPPKHLWKS